MKPFFSVSHSLCLSLALAAPLAVSQPTPAAEATPLTAETLVAEVVEKNPEIAFYAAEIEAAKAGRRTSTAPADPELSLEAGRKRVRDPLGVLAGEGAVWSISVKQAFEWPGRLALRKSIANRQVELAEIGLGRFRTALASRACVLWYGLQVSAEKTQAAREVADRYQALRELFLARDPAGLTPLLETRVIEAQEIALKRRASDAELAAQAALVELNQLRGLPLDTPARSVGAGLRFNAAPDLSALLASARENNFELRLRRVELEQQGLQVSLARNERYPAVSVSPYLSREKAGDRETNFGLGLSVPLPLTDRSRGAVDVAEARRRQGEAALATALRTLEREITLARQTFTARLAANAQWQPDAVQKFREAADLAERHYRLGAVPLATYVELQSAYLDAVDALLDTRQAALESGLQLQLLAGLDFKAVEFGP